MLATVKNGFSWWSQGLLAWLPDAVKNKIAAKPYIQCVVSGDEIVFQWVDKQGIEHNELRIDLIAELNNKTTINTWLERYKKSELILKLSEHETLSTTISLPAQAKENIDDIIKFEIDRQTPFSIDDVYYTYQINHNNTNDKPVSVRLTVVPKKTVKIQLEKLQQLSFSVTKLLLPTPNQQVIIPLSKVSSDFSLLSKATIGLGVLCMLLALMLFYKPVLYYQQQAELTQFELISIKKQAQQAIQMKKQAELQMNQHQFFLNQSASYSSRLMLLNELAEILPSHTWLDYFEINGQSLIISGQSAAVSTLPELLNATGLFSNIQFVRPITRDEVSGKNRFRLEMVIKQAQGDSNDV